MTLKIISLNIWHGALLSKVIEFLNQEGADIVILQEVYNSEDPSLPEKYRSMSVLNEHLGFKHADFSRAYSEKIASSQVPHGNAAFSSLPISNPQTIFLTDNTLEYYVDKREHWQILPSTLQHFQLKTGTAVLNIFNMHGVWDLAGDDFSERRRTMFERTLSAVKGLDNVILAGDTNATQGNPGFELLKAELTPVFEDDIKTTFNMRHKTNPGYATSAVDLMFVSPNVKVISKNVSGADVSDHLPLVVTLEIN